MRLPDRLAPVVSRYPDNIALCCKGRMLSYADLWKQSDAIAHWLQSRRVHPGDRVGILADHGIEPVVIIWAALKAGAVVVCLNEYLQSGSLKEILNDCEPAVIFTTRHYLERRLELLDRPFSFDTVVIDQDFDDLVRYPVPADWGGRSETEDAGDGNIAAIVYTSGSMII